MNKIVVITGATGFIGSHTAKVFKQAGYQVIGVDLTFTIPESTKFLDQILVADFVDVATVAIDQNQADAVIHCAGTSLVGPSISDPYTYYWNNSSKTNKLFDQLTKIGWRGKFVFSSSAAIYGIPNSNQQLFETDQQQPINPYGQSKLFCEHIIKDHCRAHGFKGIALRYFNAAGCDADKDLGHIANDTHMIPRVLSAHRTGQTFNLYGDDYHTPDGTCIRDYLHVTDIAQAHLEAVCLAESMKSGEFRAYNLGTGQGHSNKEIVDVCSRVVGQEIDFKYGPRRLGDPDYLVANSALFQNDTSWSPRNSSIENIVATAWGWERNLGS